MSNHRKNNILFLSLSVLTVFLLSACSQIGVSGPSSSNLTASQVLEKSVAAMQKLNSSHFEFKSDSTIKLNNVVATPGTNNQSATTPFTGTVKIVGSGDQALPNKQQMKLTINDTTNLQQLLQGENVYVQNTNGKWYVMSKKAIQDYVGNPFAGINLDQNTLFGLLQNARITDRGSESLNGQTMRHLNAELNKTAVNQLFSENPQLRQQFGAQNVDAVLNNTKKFVSTVDVWISEQDFYVHRTEVRLDLNADTSAVQQVIQAKDINVNFKTVLDLSRFNEPFNVTVPSNATPTDDPAEIFGFQSKPKS